MYHTGAREYDPRTGRWLQRDPIEASSGDPNFWRYCGNDPVNFTDPSGEAPQWIHAGLDLIGWVPVIGEIADGVNAGLYALEGDLENAGISLLGMIPIVGDAGKLGRTGKRIYDFASNALRSDRVYERGGAKAWRLLRGPCGRHGGFQIAKDKGGIPRSQQPFESGHVAWEGRSEPATGYKHETRIRYYDFKRSDGKVISIHEHSAGAVFPDGGIQGPHFNTYLKIDEILIPYPNKHDSHTPFVPKKRYSPRRR